MANETQKTEINKQEERIEIEVEVTKGTSYAGSGCYSAGWKVLEGEVIDEEIEGTYEDNGFRYKARYKLKAKTPIAKIKIHNGDAISSSGYRRLGSEGIIILKKT